MEKRKWLWKTKSEKSPGGTESSGSMSSHSELCSDDQDESSRIKSSYGIMLLLEGLKASPNHKTQSPEVTSKAAIEAEEINESVKILTEKLSAALVNVSAKEDLIKQHTKVAEDAVAGWEQAENDVAALKQQLEETVQQKLAVEDRVRHLDGALKECVRQLRQAREDQEQKICEAVEEKTREWASIKAELESQLLQFHTQEEAAKIESLASVDSALRIKLKTLENENSVLKLELLRQSDELEIMTIERDLSTQAAETASKQHLESIKKVAKLEAECRRLQVISSKSSAANDHISVAASSIYGESMTDSASEEQLNGTESDYCHRMIRLTNNACGPNRSDLWASALISELDQFKNEKVIRNSITCASLEIDMMDDFLEMERLAALPETQIKSRCPESEADANQSINGENPHQDEFEAMSHRVADLEENLKHIEAEKAELERALKASQDSVEASWVQLKGAEMRLEELQKDLSELNKSKELFEFQLISMEVEARTNSAKVDSLKEVVEKEWGLSVEMAVRCQELEDELTRKSQEIEIQQTAAISKGKPKIKQDDLDVAAGKLAECQKTIASLGRQLESLATLEDFLIDTANLPGFAGGASLLHSAGGELWRANSDPPKLPVENCGSSMNGKDGASLASSSVSLNYVKTRNGFGKLFSRSKSRAQLENHKHEQ